MVRPSPPMESEWKARRPMIRSLAHKSLGIGQTGTSPLYGSHINVPPQHHLPGAPPLRGSQPETILLNTYYPPQVVNNGDTQAVSPRQDSPKTRRDPCSTNSTLTT